MYEKYKDDRGRMFQPVTDIRRLHPLRNSFKRNSGAQAIFSGRTYRIIPFGSLCLTLPPFRADLFHIEHTAVCHWMAVCWASFLFL